MSDLIDGYTKSGLIADPTKGFIICNGCRFEFHPDDINDGLCENCESLDKAHRDRLNRELRSENDTLQARVKELEVALKHLKCFKATTPNMHKIIDTVLNT